MVDVLKTLGFEYVVANPASSFRGLHESFINYGGNTAPEWLTCTHEQASVNMANGYFAVAGKPMAVVTFAPSGLQHAAMGIFGAFSGRTPTYLLCANIPGGEDRRPLFDWGPHAMTDPAAMVRDMLKWDDTPASLQHFAESAVRAYRMAMTEPRGPVMLVVDAMLQEESMRDRAALRIPKLALASPPAGDAAAVAEVAKLLVAAENPLVLAGDVARDEDGHAPARRARRDAASARARRRPRHAEPASPERRRQRAERRRDPGAQRGRTLRPPQSLSRSAGPQLDSAHASRARRCSAFRATT